MGHADSRGREQMYKKRFAKWGFQKNSRRLTAASSASAGKDDSWTGTERRLDLCEDLLSMPASPTTGHHDSLVLTILTSVRVCSVAFFESVQSPGGCLAPQRIPQNHLLPEHTQEISFSIKLVMDLLNRGQGNLAGRVARKSFLLLEDMLLVQSPALIWNLLEMMHNMVVMRHERLFQMLLGHLTALAGRRIPKNHPLSAMLRGLRGLVTYLETLVFNSSGSDSTSQSASSTPSSTDGDQVGTLDNSWPISSGLSSLLAQAWTLNAEVLFKRFDARLFQLYCHVHWETCSIAPPSAILGAADKWITHGDAQQIFSPATEAHLVKEAFEISPAEKIWVLQHMLGPREDVLPPRDYKTLRTSSIAALREKSDLILRREAGYTGDPSVLLSMMAVLITAKMIEVWPVLLDGTTISEGVGVPHGEAGHVACAMKTLMQLKREEVGDRSGTSPDMIEQIQSVVALREYANGFTNPQVIREMWRLQEALTDAGRYEEATEVERESLRRLETYIEDIPADFA